MRLFGILLVIIIQATSFSQNTNSFEIFLKAFESQETCKYIPLEISINLFGKEIIMDNENIQAIEAEKLFKFDERVITLIKIYQYSPAESSDYYLIKFSDEGELIDFLYLGGTFISPNDHSFSTNFEMINDSILEVNKSGGFSSEKHTYYLISSGNYKKIEPKPVLRPNAITSKKILRLNELREMSISELDIIRNEIFADHGYIFKTEKWKCYFDNQYWYSPIYNDVTDELTIIERININNILIVSEEKR